MNIILIVVCVAFFVTQAIGLKKDKYKNDSLSILNTAVVSAIIAVIMWITVIVLGEVASVQTIICGLAFGILFIITLLLYYTALRLGPLSYTSFFFSSSMILGAVCGTIFWKEKFTVMSIMAIILFFVAFYLVAVPGRKNVQKGNSKWLIYCTLLWLCNGILSLCGKVQQTLMAGTQSLSMTAWGFTFSAIIGTIAFFLLKRKCKLKVDCFEHIKLNFTSIFLVAIGTGVGNLIITYLAAKVPSAYLYPLILGGTMTAVNIISIAILKEKVNIFGKIGLLISIVAIILLI